MWIHSRLHKIAPGFIALNFYWKICNLLQWYSYQPFKNSVYFVCFRQRLRHAIVLTRNSKLKKKCSSAKFVKSEYICTISWNPFKYYLISISCCLVSYEVFQLKLCMHLMYFYIYCMSQSLWCPCVSRLAQCSVWTAGIVWFMAEVATSVCACPAFICCLLRDFSI